MRLKFDRKEASDRLVKKFVETLQTLIQLYTNCNDMYELAQSLILW